MRERPILFSGPMIRAILDGRKTQTRRIVKPQPPPDYFTSPVKCEWYAPTLVNHRGEDYPGETVFGFGDEESGWVCPYGSPGDRLWVRESFAIGPKDHGWGQVIYKATHSAGLNPLCEGFTKWKPSIYMPRWASRITLEITDVRVQRVQEISEEDIRAEGVTLAPTELYPHTNTGSKLRRNFEWLWDSVNGPGAWARNDWVWAITLKRINP